jgi:PAS domain S-box-containing protein
MSELEDLRRRDSELRARLAEVEEVVEAFKNGEIDAVVQDGAATPVLLRAAQEKLREREQFLRALFDGATDAILVADASGRYIDANPAACAMFGLPRERILRRTITDFAVPGYEVPESWATFVSEGKMTGEFPLLRPDGTRRNLEFSAVANVLPGVNLSILRDVTERKIAEATIRQRQATLEHAEAVAQVGSWRSGASPTDAVSWSAGCARIFGQAPENPPTAVGFMRWVHPDDYAYVVEANQRAVAENVPCDTEHRIVLSSGEVRWVRSNAIIHGMLHWSANGFTADVDTLGRPYHVVGVVQDITERKRAEDELRASETRYRRMIENTSEGVWLIDASGVTTFVNARLAEMLGRSVEDVIGQPVFAFMDEATVHLVRRRLERRKGGVAERGDLRLVRQDGTDIWVSRTQFSTRMASTRGRSPSRSTLPRSARPRPLFVVPRTTFDRLKKWRRSEASPEAWRTTSTTSFPSC